MKKILLTLTALGAGAAFIVAPVAQAGDKDKDHKKDKKEWFAEADTDKDGSLTLAEFTAAKGDKMEADEVEAKFKKYDGDNDGKVTMDECKAKWDKKHDKHDKDKAAE